jgi:pyruvate/2-oxoglutarate dehydrogenase complex dihydrolipoamide acyltransferase (E2) component
LSLVLKYGIKDVDSIQASGNGGRILKGDVLAHLGLIAPKPAPKATLSVAPPRDQIVFAKVKCKKKKNPYIVMILTS